MGFFYENQDRAKKEKYINSLKIIGSLSNLFSESVSPFIHYRFMERTFSDSFDCIDLSRHDITIDVKKDRIGIGLKTFLHNSNGSFQKIAEFNKVSHLFRGITDNYELIKSVALFRNKRIDFVIKTQGIKQTIYHLITRDIEKLFLFEQEMHRINLETLFLEKINPNSIIFNDTINQYSFSKSKNTLMMKFLPKKTFFLEEINVKIYDNPSSILEKLLNNTITNIEDEFIILPLYSDRSNEVPTRAGLNMWNASGRVRDINEIYIQIPIWIHRKFPNFFNYSNENYNTNSFNIILPNEEMISAKVTQSNGKALQSNPNKRLGEWLLRDVLNLKPGELITKKLLDEIGIDSIKLSKINNHFKLDFLETGSYKSFKEKSLFKQMM